MSPSDQSIVDAIEHCASEDLECACSVMFDSDRSVYVVTIDGADDEGSVPYSRTIEEFPDKQRAIHFAEEIDALYGVGVCYPA